jgi:hypothetical protein
VIGCDPSFIPSLRQGGDTNYSPKRPMNVESRHWLKTILKISGALAAIIGVVAGVLAIVQFMVNRPAVDVTGWWELTNTIESTSYSKYQGMKLGYRVFLQQDGKKIIGRGEKWLENGEQIPSIYHSPITIDGKLVGRTLTATFEEKGALRTTCGNFIWTVSSDGRYLNGIFDHTAANSKGISIGQRIR